MYIINERDTNLVFNQVRATAHILLNYKCGPTRCLGVNAAIIDHIRRSLLMSHSQKKEKVQVYKDCKYSGQEYSRIQKLTVSALP